MLCSGYRYANGNGISRTSGFSRGTMRPDVLEPGDALEGMVFFERERTDRHVVEMPILRYSCGMTLPRASQVPGGWGGRTHVEH